MSIVDRLKEIQQRLEGACSRSGRAKEEVTLMAVSKTVGVDQIREAAQAGIDLFGENRVQEAKDKVAALSDLNLTWHLIGHLQKNKVPLALDLFQIVQSVDSLSLADRMERVASQKECVLPVFIEVNIGREPTKHGFVAEEVEEACAKISEMEHLQLHGLMAIPPYHPDPERVRPYFVSMADLFHSLSARYSRMEHLSMGMSEDFEVAVEEGSTLIRLGRILFGERG